MRSSWFVVLASALPFTAVLAFSADGRAVAEAGAGRVCFSPYPITFEQTIQNAYKSAFAVFSGKVRTQTLETATITVTRVWKGKLGAEVAMPTGSRDAGGGLISIDSEAFVFRTGEEYIIFGHGTSAETLLAADVCKPNIRLADAKRTIAVLDQLAKRGG